jgi:hypothetical protein
MHKPFSKQAPKQKLLSLSKYTHHHSMNNAQQEQILVLAFN